MALDDEDHRGCDEAVNPRALRYTCPWTREKRTKVVSTARKGTGLSFPFPVCGHTIRAQCSSCGLLATIRSSFGWSGGWGGMRTGVRLPMKSRSARKRMTLFPQVVKTRRPSTAKGCQLCWLGRRWVMLVAAVACSRFGVQMTFAMPRRQDLQFTHACSLVPIGFKHAEIQIPKLQSYSRHLWGTPVVGDVAHAVSQYIPP